MCFDVIIMSVVFAARIARFCGFPTSTTGRMKAICFNVVHDTKVGD